ncbi:MAG: caspase family protein [Thermoguttaceae bacterium]
MRTKMIQMSLCIGILLISARTPSYAQWLDAGNVGGTSIWRDSKTGLEWTTSLSRTSSHGAARQRVANLGFRLPSHSEFRSLERNGGIQKLRMDSSWAGGYYWESTGGIVNGNGGNFKSLFPVSHPHVGDPYAIGVRKGNNVDSGRESEKITNTKTKVHLIVAGDVNSNLRGAVDVSSNEIYRTLISGLGNTPLEFYQIPRENLRPETILKFINNCSIGKNDTVIFCYFGHGASDPNKGVFYTITDPSTPYTDAKQPHLYDSLLKNDVKNQILQHSPRLVVLISDCCSVHFTFLGEEKAVCGATINPPQPLFKKLFLDSRGVVDFTAAQQDYTGWCNSEVGFWLTHNLCEALEHNQQKNLSWTVFFPIVRERTKEYSLKQYNANPTNSSQGWNYNGVLQIPMVPRAFSLGN